MTRKLLDTEQLIRRRRLTLGLSERELAKQLGVTGYVVHALERDANHPDLPTALIAALAGALALTPNDLFGQSAAADDDTDPDVAPDADLGRDAAAVGALLGLDGRLVPTAALGEAFDWPAQRVEAAVDELAARLPAVGLRLHRLGNDVSVVTSAEAAAVDVVERLARRVMARRGLTSLQGRLLHEAWHGQLTRTMPTNPERVALGALANAGLITVPTRDTRGEQPELTADVRFSLALDNPPHTHTRSGRGAATRRTAKRASRTRSKPDSPSKGTAR